MSSLDAFEPPVFAITRHGTKTGEPGPLASAYVAVTDGLHGGHGR